MDIDGINIAASRRAAVKEEIEKKSLSPAMVFILVGEDAASQVYVKMKEKACKEVGIKSLICQLPKETTEQALLAKINEFNENDEIDGILCQMPLPNQIHEDVIINAISPKKDVDGFHPINVGKMCVGDESGFLPCTPAGIMKILEHENIETSGKEVVIIGRSNIVGKPLSILLSQKRPFANATVTLTHSRTNNLAEACRRADILIAAIGRPRFVTKDMVKPGAIVIDVGINREGKKLTGDVDYENVAPIASAITPVPGGVGPLTISTLMENTLLSHKRRTKK